MKAVAHEQWTVISGDELNDDAIAALAALLCDLADDRDDTDQENARA